MEIKEFIDLVFDRASKLNLEEYEIYYNCSQSSSLKVYSGEIESYSENRIRGVSLRGKYKNKMGYAYTELLNEETVDFLIQEVMDNSSILECDEEEEIFGDKREYHQVKTYFSELDENSVEQEKNFLLDIERIALKLDPRVKSVNYCMYGKGFSERVIRNSKGINLNEKNNSAYCYISVLAEEGAVKKTGNAFRIIKNVENVSAKEIATEAVTKALEKIPVDFIESQTISGVIINEAVSSLLGAMSGIFSAENIQKGVSKLKDKLGKRISSEKITLVDDPHLEEGYGSSSFDAEGVPTKYKEIISNGILNSILYNLKTAKKDNVETTGNAAKGGYKGTMGISPFNLYIKSGTDSFEKLLEEVGNGLLITSFTGFHSGLNPISGDFSLASEGFIIQDGKKAAPLNQIIVSGNFYDLLLEIQNIGNDLKFDMSGVGSPSISIKKLNISA
jgi:PmbA protein